MALVVEGDDYTVFLTNLQRGQRTQTTSFHNTDNDRGRTPGCVGIQAYSGSYSRLAPYSNQDHVAKVGVADSGEFRQVRRGYALE